MSAIGAIFHRDGRPVERRALDRMRTSLRLYGPDRDGVEADGCMGLVWTHMIGFTPQDRQEFQPMALPGGAMMVFAGRLDHGEELCAALGLPAARAATITDCELARRAWEAWGQDCARRLHGDFAFIVADARHRRIVAARSPLRGHPIHYVEQPDRIVLASMPKGLFALGDVPRELDDQQLADMLVLNFQDREATCFKGVHSLPLGHMLVAGPDEFRITRFYDIADTPPLRYARDADYVERARELVEAAVANAMRSVETPAVKLSSGLDSTCVAVTALGLLDARGSGERLFCVTAVPEPGWDGRAFGAWRVGDESGPVRALAERYPALDVHFIDSAGVSLDQGMEQVLAAADMPMRNVTNMHWGQELSRTIRASGRRVALSGGGGNATISMSAASQVIAGLFRHGHWLSLARELRAFNERQGNRRWLGFGNLVSLALVPNMPRGLYAAYRRRWPASFEIGWQRYSAIHPDFASGMGIEQRFRELGWNDAFQPAADRRTLLASMLDRGVRHRGGAFSLASQAVRGVQGRDPLGDRRLVEFCYAIPDDQFYRQGMDRRLVRRLMADRLPGEVLTAPRGRQAADWHLRLTRDLARFDAELDVLAEDPQVAQRIDIPRLRAALHALPAQTPLTRNDHPDLAIAMVGFTRALAMARFIRSIEGRNR
ncbi:asparagine synthetase B family protein [Sphingomonas canadensis]|uniref:asparagine synthase (glutamine-hydrolyzing) n=1 Tax=Sphingomonas canadensis TaxID=1219257 RepID=A0ABW3HEM8_9SPHN|nr:asparagine synthetase B [Sphingomonas canadensis]MCW3837664.1 asparagine synthase-related protein [Sphingomonas canadensis]